MNQPTYLWNPPPVPSLAVRGHTERFPVHRLFFVGRNYHAHARELQGSVFKDNAKAVDAWPIVFSKVPECVVPGGADVVLPNSVSTQIDYEAELAVVIGRFCRKVPVERAALERRFVLDECSDDFVQVFATNARSLCALRLHQSIDL